jgi:mono/diheme cytochrome c family protein
MKKILTMVLAIGILGTWGLTAAQAKPNKRCDSEGKACRLLTFPDLQQGYHLFRNNCKTCHHWNNDQGAQFLYTESLSMKGWNRVFAKRYSTCARKGHWDKLSQEELAKINDYLYANAWDASDPHVSL